MEYRKYFNTSKASVEKSALDLWHFCEWIGKFPTDLISEYVDTRTDFGKLQDWRRETKNAVLRFYHEQKAKGYKVNMARNCVIGVMAFYSQNCEQVKGITKQLDPVQIPDNEFVFTQENLRRLYYYGNVQEKTWLSVAVSLGYASVDFLGLETEKISNLVREAKEQHKDFIGFVGKSRTKTSVQPRSFLTPEAVERTFLNTSKCLKNKMMVNSLNTSGITQLMIA